MTTRDREYLIAMSDRLSASYRRIDREAGVELANLLAEVDRLTGELAAMTAAHEAAIRERDSLRLELDAERHCHLKDNEHLIRERDEARGLLRNIAEWARGLAPLSEEASTVVYPAEARIRELEQEQREAFRAGFLATVGVDDDGRPDASRWAFDGPAAADREPEAYTAWLAWRSPAPPPSATQLAASRVIR